MSGARAVRLGPKVRELRIHLCQRSPTSQGVRDFIEQHYVPVKKQNPKFPILIRECSSIEPKMWARYEFGKETSVSLSDMSSTEVLETMESLANRT